MHGTAESFHVLVHFWVDLPLIFVFCTWMSFRDTLHHSSCSKFSHLPVTLSIFDSNGLIIPGVFHLRRLSLLCPRRLGCKLSTCNSFMRLPVLIQGISLHRRDASSLSLSSV